MARAKRVEQEVPSDQEVQIEVGDEEELQAPEQVAEVPDKTRTEPPETEPALVQEPETESALRKRLEEQIRAEILAEQARKDAASQAESQRQIAEANRQAQENWRRAQEAERRAKQSDYDSVVNALGAAQSEADAAQRDWEAAANAGDVKAQAEAQRRLSRAEARVERFEEAKLEYDARIEQERTAPQRPQQPQPTQQQVLESRISQLPDSAKDWFRKHPDYVFEPAKSAAVTHWHNEAVAAGHAVLSPEYFEFVESKLGMRQPKQESRRTDVTAPVTREAPSSNGQRGPTQITLTPEERQLARQNKPDPKMTDAQAEALYARNKLKLIQMKKNGDIQ